MGTFAETLRYHMHRPRPQRLLLALRRARGTDRRRIARYLRGHPVAKLQIGAGRNLRDGWLNTNFFPLRNDESIFLDATERFPLPDACLDYVYSEHMIEHVPYAGGAAMLRECIRVLKPGGTLRLSTPDLGFLLDLQRPGLSDVQRRYVAAQRAVLPADVPVTPATVLNNFVRFWGHSFIYDRATLVDLIERSGFVDITACEVGRSDDPLLAGMDHVGRMDDGFLALESMVFEARKPDPRA